MTIDELKAALLPDPYAGSDVSVTKALGDYIDLAPEIIALMEAAYGSVPVSYAEAVITGKGTIYDALHNLEKKMVGM